MEDRTQTDVIWRNYKKYMHLIIIDRCLFIFYE